jgi:hypothetical protein
MRDAHGHPLKLVKLLVKSYWSIDLLVKESLVNRITGQKVTGQ